jgi:hypothetical protein
VDELGVGDEELDGEELDELDGVDEELDVELQEVEELDEVGDDDELEYSDVVLDGGFEEEYGEDSDSEQLVDE